MGTRFMTQLRRRHPKVTLTFIGSQPNGKVIARFWTPDTQSVAIVAESVSALCVQVVACVICRFSLTV
jgi:hypothetical protein